MTDHNESTSIVPYMRGNLNLALLDVHLDQEKKHADVAFEVYSRKPPEETRERHAVLSVRVPCPKGSSFERHSERSRPPAVAGAGGVRPVRHRPHRQGDVHLGLTPGERGACAGRDPDQRAGRNGLMVWAVSTCVGTPSSAKMVSISWRWPQPFDHAQLLQELLAREQGQAEGVAPGAPPIPVDEGGGLVECAGQQARSRGCRRP